MSGKAMARTTNKKYAEGTKVTVPRSREEIEKLLKAYGANGFAFGYDNDVAAILFQLKGRRYRIELRYPPIDSFRKTGAGAVRTEAQMRTAAEAEEKRLWRELALVIKAKLIAVKSGIMTMEDEFLAYTVMANNQTVKEWVNPQLEEMYASGKMPPLLPGLGGGESQQKNKQIGQSGAIEGEFTSE